MDRTRASAIGRRLTPAIWAILPAAVVVGLLMVGGLSVALVDSLSGASAFENFRLVLTAPGFGASLLLSLWVAGVSTLLTVLIALASAFSLRRLQSLRRFVTYIYQLPLTLPHIVVAAAGLMLLTQSGVLSRLATAIGLISAPAGFPALVFDRAGIGIIIAYVWKQVPFVGLIALSVLHGAGREYEEVARTLGARPRQVIRHVLVPLVVPGLVPASIIVFAFVLGAFEVPLLLGSRYPSMLSVLAYRLYTDVDISLRPQAMAMSLLIAVLVLVLTAIYRAILSRRSA